MMQRDGLVKIASATLFAGCLLGLAPVGAAAEPGAAPASPPGEAAPATAPAAEPAAAKPAATPDKAADKLADKPADKTEHKPGDKAAGKAGPPMPPGSSVKVERTASGAKLFRITEGMLVEGQMQRPNAFLVLQRATVDYDYEALSESFLPRIIAATREKPF
jgi:hypothetical protein